MNSESKYKLQQLAKDAILVQDACNLSGIVHGFSRTMTALRDIYPDKDTAFFNTHAIAVMWASKIASLTNCESTAAFNAAYNACKDMAGEG